MIQPQTRLKVADNSGAKKVACIKVLGGSHRASRTVGDIIMVAVKEAVPHSKVKKGDVMQAVIVRTAKEVRRVDGPTSSLTPMPPCCFPSRANPWVPVSSDPWPVNCVPRTHEDRVPRA